MSSKSPKSAAKVIELQEEDFSHALLLLCEDGREVCLGGKWKLYYNKNKKKDAVTTRGV